MLPAKDAGPTACKDWDNVCNSCEQEPTEGIDCIAISDAWQVIQTNMVCSNKYILSDSRKSPFILMFRMLKLKTLWYMFWNRLFMISKDHLPTNILTSMESSCCVGVWTLSQDCFYGQVYVGGFLINFTIEMIRSDVSCHVSVMCSVLCCSFQIM